MFTLLLATAAALTGFVHAQNSTLGGYYSTSGPLQVDPNSIDLDLRKSWCTGQKNNCPLICAGPDASLGDAFPNDCDPSTLTYNCVCENGNKPNISDYIDTLPYYVCSRWRDVCTADHPNDLTGQTACQSVVCGDRNASEGANSAGGSASASASGSASPSATASSTSGGSAESSGSSTASGAASSSTESGNAAVVIGMEYGTGILMGGLLAIFGLAL